MPPDCDRIGGVAKDEGRAKPLIDYLSDDPWVDRLITGVLLGLFVVLVGLLLHVTVILGVPLREPYNLSTLAHAVASITCGVIALIGRARLAARIMLLFLLPAMIVEGLLASAAVFPMTAVALPAIVIIILFIAGLFFSKPVVLAMVGLSVVSLLVIYLTRQAEPAALVPIIRAITPVVIATTVIAGAGVVLWEAVSSRLFLRAQMEAHRNELLVRESNHRIKNNFQVVASLLQLQEEASGRPEVKKDLEAARRRIEAFQAVHDALAQSQSLGTVGLRDFLFELMTNILQGVEDSRVPVDLKLDVPSVDVTPRVAGSLGLVVNELATNSIQHAFPGVTHPSISLSLANNESGEAVLVVSDNGVGMGPENNSDSSNQLGLQLVRGIVESQLRGRILFEGGDGTTARITFPLSNPSEA